MPNKLANAFGFPSGGMGIHALGMSPHNDANHCFALKVSQKAAPELASWLRSII
jgi:hypothetical protein